MCTWTPSMHHCIILQFIKTELFCFLVCFSFKGGELKVYDCLKHYIVLLSFHQNNNRVTFVHCPQKGTTFCQCFALLSFSVLNHRYLCCVQTAVIEHCHGNQMCSHIVGQCFAVVIPLTPFHSCTQRSTYLAATLCSGLQELHFYLHKKQRKEIES